MTNTKITKRALLSSVLSLVLCVSMLLGTTYAWFTDSVVSGSNLIQTGNLDLEVEYTLDGENWADLDGATDLFQKGLWEPGHTEVVVLRLVNNGTLALKYSASMNILSEVVGKTKDGDDIVLSDILTVSTLTQQVNAFGDIAVSLAFTSENAASIWSTAETTSFKETRVMENNILAGESHYVLLKVDMSEDIGNEANHNGVNIPSIEFGLSVLATQYSYENDSFGNQYDWNAEFDEFWGSIADTSWYNDTATEFELSNSAELAGLAKLVNSGVDSFSGKSFTLSGNIDLGNTEWTPIGVSGNTFQGTFNGNGKTVSNLLINTETPAVGLFGIVGAGAKISDLTIDNVKIDGTGENAYRAGALFGYSNGKVTVDNVSVTGNIEISIDDLYAGGLFGQAKGAVVTNCTITGEDGSYIESGRWVGGISGYDNGAHKVSGCTVENLTLKSPAYVGGIAALGAANANINSNTVKNVNIVLENASALNTMTYGTVVGGTAIYSYSTAPLAVDANTVENVTCTVNEAPVSLQQIGSKYADGTDQGLVMLTTINLGGKYYTYMKKAIEAAPKDGTTTVIELTGDTMITAKFKPSVAKNQNIVIKTNGYNLIWVEQDANKVPVTNADGSLATVIITAENMSSYFSVKAGGSLVIE